MTATENRHSTDVVIIGAGPVGLFAVFQCGMLGLRCHVVDSLEQPGGQCAALYPDKPIYDIPACPSLTGAELIDRLEEQAKPFAPAYHLNQQATGLAARAGGGWTVTTSQGIQIDCAAVIIAAGAGAFGPNRPPLEGIETFEGKSVFYLVRRREDFTGKAVAIAGGGDSAVDWALALSPVARKIYFIHRRDKFRAAPESVARLMALAGEGRVEIVVPYQLSKLHGANGVLEAVEVADTEGKTRKLDADALLPFFGLAASLGPVADWGVTVAQHHIPVDPATQGTNLPGVFAIGDVCAYPNKLNLILTGFAEAATAAHAIFPLARPGQALHFVHSTTKGVP